MASKLIKKSIFIEKNLLSSIKKKDDDDDDETVQRLIASNKNGKSSANHSHAQIVENNSRGSNHESLNVRGFFGSFFVINFK